MIYTASYFKQYPEGITFAISNSRPSGIITDFWWKSIVPEWNLVNNFKNKIVNWLEFSDQYNKYINNLDLTKTIDYFNKQNKNIILLCWEHNPINCHRIILANHLINKYNLSVIVR